MDTKNCRHSFLQAVFMAGSLGVLTLVTACGGQAYRTEATPQAQGQLPGNTPSTGSSGVPTFTNAGNTGGGNTTQTTVGSNEDFSDASPAESHSFTLTGSGGNTPSYTVSDVVTDNLLKVRIVPGAAGNLSATDGSYSNFTANYTCVSFKVTVGGYSTTTPALSVNGADCSWANESNPTLAERARTSGDRKILSPTSWTIDLSSRVTRGSTSITVSEARYDFYCQQYAYCMRNAYYNPYLGRYQSTVRGCDSYLIGTGYSTFCPLRTAYRTHTLTGTIEVQTNGTRLVQ